VSTAAQSEQSTASSVASTAAWKSGFRSRSANERSSEVAKATKISPLPWCASAEEGHRAACLLLPVVESRP
jgi:hypothetical protein